MKILYVATVSNTINAFLIPHIKFLIEKGHQVDIACSINQELKDELKNLDVEVFNIPFSRKPYNLSNLKAYKSLKKVISENGYDIIHSHTPVASFICRLITRKSQSIKRIYTAHGFHFYKGAPLLNWLIYYPIEKYLSKYTDVLITINKEDYERASKNMKAKKTVLINGVGIEPNGYTNQVSPRNLRTEYNLDKDNYLIFSIGELNKNKNHKVVIRALSTLKNPKIYYMIAGEGSQRFKLEKMIRKLKLQSNVILLGYVERASELLRDVDLFIMPSKREGLPVSLLEAVSKNVFSVGSNIRGIKDILVDQELLFNPSNHFSTGQFIKNKFEFPNKNKYNAIDIKKYSLENVLEDLAKRVYKFV